MVRYQLSWLFYSLLAYPLYTLAVPLARANSATSAPPCRSGAHGRPRAQEHAAEAHEAKQAFDTARHGEATDEAVRSRLKRGYRSAHLRSRPVAAEVVLMHHRGLGDAHGRPRAQEDAAEAHDAKPVARHARLGGGGDGALRSDAQEVVTKRSRIRLKRAVRWLGR